MKVAVRAQQRLLRQIIRTASVATESKGQIYQWTVPALHDAFKRIDVASQETLFHTGMIVAGAQSFTLEEYDRLDNGTVAFFSRPIFSW